MVLLVGSEWAETMKQRLDPRVEFIIINNMIRNISFFRDVRAFFEILFLLKDFEPDVLHTHESKAGILGRFAAAVIRRKTKIVHGVHIIPFVNTTSKFQYAFYFLLEKLASYFTDEFISVSPALAEVMIEKNLAKESNNHVIFSGMDLNIFSTSLPPSDELVKSLFADKYAEFISAFKIVIAGTLEKRKRVEIGLQAIKKLKDCGENAFLIVCGGGRESDNLLKLSYELGIENNVLFTGYTSNISDYIKCADLGLHCSEHEGLPRVIIQYLASGKPVISSALAGVDLVIKDGKNGYLLRTDDLVCEISEKIYSLIHDKAKYEKFAVEAKRTELSDWDQKKMVSNIENVYRGGDDRI